VHREENDGRKGSSLSNICGKHTCKKVSYSAESKKESSDGHMRSMEAGCNKENRTVNVLTSGKLDAVLVFVRLAEKEGHTQKNGQK
jgi:hypothetical protein